MNQNRKGQAMPKGQSKMDKAGGSRDSVLGSKESFEHGSHTSEMARGMGSSGTGSSSGSDSSDKSDSPHSKSGISNRGFDEERERQGRVPERGRAQSEE